MKKILLQIEYYLQIPLEKLFGDYDHHLVNEKFLGDQKTKSGSSYSLYEGRYIRCRNKFYPILKLLPFYGITGWRVTTYNKVNDGQTELYLTQIGELEMMVEHSNKIGVKQIMGDV